MLEECGLLGRDLMLFSREVESERDVGNEIPLRWRANWKRSRRL